MTRTFTIASALLALAAAAPAVHAEGADQTTVRVSYADLNLASASGRQVLDQRISHAVGTICGERPILSDLDGQRAYGSCQKAARSSVDGQMKAMMTTVADNSGK